MIVYRSPLGDASLDNGDFSIYGHATAKQCGSDKFFQISYYSDWCANNSTTMLGARQYDWTTTTDELRNRSLRPARGKYIYGSVYLVPVKEVN